VFPADPGEIAIDFLFGERTTRVIAVTRDSVGSCELSVGRAGFTSLGHDILTDRDCGASVSGASGRTWDRTGMFKPLLDLLKHMSGERSRLAIIGDGPQSGIPFEALEIDEGKEKKPLIDRFAISYRSSLGAAQRSAWISSLHNGRVLMVGDVVLPLTGSMLGGDAQSAADSRNASGILRSLPGTLKEMQLLEDRFGSRLDILRGTEATDERFCASAPGYWLVHLATHGAARTAESKAHVLFLSPSSNSDGEVGFDDVLSMEMKGCMVVLPACLAGQSSLTGDVESMAHAFLEAGASSVLAARWTVSDELGSEFFSSFYAGLCNGESRSAAVRSAMQEMIARGHHSYRVWAGFQLLGDGGPMPMPELAIETGTDRAWTAAVGSAVLLFILGYGWRRWPIRTCSHCDGKGGK
jgi:hypothetical protein